MRNLIKRKEKYYNGLTKILNKNRSFYQERKRLIIKNKTEYMNRHSYNKNKIQINSIQ